MVVWVQVPLELLFECFHVELVYKSVSKTDALNWAAGSSPAGSTFFIRLQF